MWTVHTLEHLVAVLLEERLYLRAQFKEQGESVFEGSGTKVRECMSGQRADGEPQRCVCVFVRK